MLVSLVLLAGGSPTMVRGSTSFGISLSATPSNGLAPLPVSFAITVLSGTPSSFNWSFGDGTYLNGTNSSDGSPTHVYTEPGRFLATVVVHEESNVASRQIAVNVSAPKLAASIAASSTSGTLPLTVQFDATVTGGTGTYLTLRWDFGDGGVGAGLAISYTYERAGAFVATFTVNDSGGGGERSVVSIRVSPVPTDAPTPRSGLPTSVLAGWVALSFAVGIVAAFAVQWGLRRRSTRQRLELDRAERTLEGEPVPPPADDGARPGAMTLLEPGPSVLPRTPPPSDRPIGTESGRPSSQLVVRPPVEGLRVSQRIVLHLARQGALHDDDVATVGYTQAGMASALGVRQNALTNVLTRLMAAQILRVELRHVSGQPRRLKVYTLTSRGEALARDLRTEVGPDPGAH
ncbi:MAG: PKD domain-containing protein [Thermoplasmata archaeon]|nr:PKD domain-containing protein [Thermoplasmata archaeon]